MRDIISRNVVPPGGWYFRAGMYDLRGNSYDELRKTVSDHYTNNHIEIRDIDEAIQMQTASRWPEGILVR